MPKKTLSAQTRATMKYQKSNMKQVKFNFHKVNDKDIIDKLASVESMQGYVKDLIRADIAKNK